jgi:PleD family two-component response regulator
MNNDEYRAIVEAGPAVVLDADVRLYDAELAAAGHYAGAWLALSRHGGASAQMEVVLHRLRELESETQRLRTDLEEQHVLTLLDPLTGVFNRLGYAEGMAREYARWRRYGGQLSLAM